MTHVYMKLTVKEASAVYAALILAGARNRDDPLESTWKRIRIFIQQRIRLIQKKKPRARSSPRN